jgi:uncharacterized protein YidB (DUF937 family)
MALLEDLLGGMLGAGADPQRPQPMGGGRAPQAAGGGGMSSVMMALLPVVLSMLASRGRGAGQAGSGAGGGGLGEILGQVLGGGAQRGGGGGMGDILGQVLGGGAQRGGGGGMGDILGQVLGSGGAGGAGGGTGGLGGLLEQMQRAGYGEQARSWVGTGQNVPISPDVLGEIFGQGGIEEIARQAGVTPQQASTGLSELLPEVVNHVTPNGQVPDLDQLALSVENLRRRMGA